MKGNQLLAPLLGMVAAVLLSSQTTSAHHSLSAVYDSGQPLTLEAEVTDFAFIHPHPYLTVAVRGNNAAPESWRLEMDNRFELEEIGITDTTFKAGERIVVTGSQSRNGAKALYVRRLDRPADGFRYEQVGPSPRISTPSRQAN